MTPEFSKQYLSPNWQKKRLEIMQRDEFRCQCCYGSEKTLNVHHKKYIQGLKVWEHSDCLLITLCSDCHKTVEENKRKIFELLDKHLYFECGNNLIDFLVLVEKIEFYNLIRHTGHLKRELYNDIEEGLTNIIL